MVNVKTPHAAAIIWNYEDRLGEESTPNSAINKVTEIIINTASLISIQTSKSKGSPVGSFQIMLAPTKNWVAAITAGSWIAIMMSQTEITQSDLPRGNGKAKPYHVKMIGKVESVRMNVTVDPTTGARNTQYLLVGSDWGHIFENVLYVDEFIDPKVDNVGNTAWLALLNQTLGNGTPIIKSTFQLVKSVLSMISASINFNPSKGGNPSSFKGDSKKSTGTKNSTQGDTVFAGINRIAKANYDFKIPAEMVKFLGLGGKNGSTSTANMLRIYSGTLDKYDSYTPKTDSAGMLDPTGFRGQHTIWQLILDHSNPVLNETYTDLVWDTTGTPQLGLYNRIRPFSIDSKKLDDGNVRSLESPFQNVKRFDINADDVLSLEAGTNWRDKYNFIEIRLEAQYIADYQMYAKSQAQEYDANAFQREGFRPLIVSTKQFPVKGMKVNDVSGSADTKDSQSINPVDINQLLGWKSLLRKWYFDTHKMLNGRITFFGQNQHIEVGSNILVPAYLLGPTYNMTIGEKSSKDKGNIYMLAHVESIEHNFTVTQDGSRSFISTIQFVRGIIVDQNSRIIKSGHIDDKIGSGYLQPKDVRNTDNILAVSHENDPDNQKLVSGTVKR